MSLGLLNYAVSLADPFVVLCRAVLPLEVAVSVI